MEYKAKPTEEKKKIVADIVQSCKESTIIGLVDMENLPAPQLQAMKAKLRETVKLFLTKKRLMKIAFQQIEKEKKEISKLVEHFKGMPALLFTKDNPFKLAKTLQDNKSAAPAKAGQEAPYDIIIPSGKTSFAPGPIISELGSIGIKTGVEDGKVAVKEDSLVAKKGDKINAKTAEILGRMGIEPMEVGLDLIAVYEEGVIYTKDVLTVDQDKFISDFNKACSGAFNVAMFIGYTNKDTIQPLIGKAFTEAKVLGLEAEIIDQGVIDELISKAEQSMLSLKNTANIEVVEKPKVEEKKREPPKKETKVEEKTEQPKEEEKGEEPAVDEKPKEEKPKEPESKPEEQKEEQKVEPKEEKKPKPPKEEKKQEPPREKPVEDVPKEVSETPTVSDDAQKSPISDKPDVEEKKEKVKEPEVRAEPKEQIIIKKEKEILEEEKTIEKEVEEKKTLESPSEQEVEQEIKEEEEKQLEKEKLDQEKKLKDLDEKKRPEISKPTVTEPKEKITIKEEKKEVDDKVKDMVQETKDYIDGKKGPSADDIISEVTDDQKAVEKTVQAKEKEIKKDEVPSAHDLQKEKEEKEQKEVEELAKKLTQKGTLRKS